MPLQATSGAASYDAFGGGAAVAPKYIEDFFQTWLRTGTGSSATVTTGLNASINKSLVWTKSRSAATNHKLTDTVRGATKALSSNTTGAQVTDSQGLTAFGSTGYTIGTDTNYNNSGATYVDWQWLATPKFFDCLTYTGTGGAGNRIISHNLGSTPGCILVKNTSTGGGWLVLHRSMNASTPWQYFMELQTTNAASNIGTDLTPTSTTFQVDEFNNTSGATYVAYLFAHNAGGFGLTGTDNVISCGSYTGTGASGNNVTVGYEPQWLLIKSVSASGSWMLYDSMRGFVNNSTDGDFSLVPNSTTDEASWNGPTGSVMAAPTATGFTLEANGANFNTNGVTYIYIAIRRGPMKVPTTGTSVYTSASRTGTAGVIPRWTAGFPVDWALRKSGVTTGGSDWQAGDRLRGAVQLKPNLTEVETAASLLYTFSSMTGYSSLGAVGSDTADRSWMFRRAPGFFDEVCYTGTDSPTTVNHNLGVAPDMMLVKRRNDTSTWHVYASPLGNTQSLALNSADEAVVSSSAWVDTDPTSTTFKVASYISVLGGTYVAYLFATCPGVSKVGSYTGTGTTQTINCGFAAGARFVLIKRTDSTGDWYVWDTARGIVAGNDPYLLLNSTAAEVTNTDYIDTASTGFEISSTAPAAINASGGTFIFLAIA